ncbi:MAG TPA: hypothetical protein VIY69_11920, partial [Candidatus Acidoferrales bacterium]
GASSMFPKKLIQRLLAVAVVTAVVALTTGSVTHVHNAASEATCQVCHISHASAPGPSAPASVPIQTSVTKLVLAEEISPAIAPYRAPSIPRAPPA